jgi:16S rRNA (cytosine967-C5)-methyltransferase
LTKGSAALLQDFASKGEIYLQDEASQLVAYALGATSPQSGERILDVCAAPGSKTTHIAVLTGDQARIIAGDYHPHRLQTLRESAARQHLRSIRTVTFNAEQSLPFAEQSFQKVLVDAPCSGTGTLRHNPEIRWRISPTDISQLAGRQKRILHEASEQVSHGGRLVYSTCSVEPEENEAVIADFLPNHPEFRIVADVFDEALRTSAGAARTWPHRQGADGFFVAVMERAG